MKIPELKGCGTALVTPFFEDGEVDYDAYSSLVQRQVEGGVDFLVPLGTTAETPTLDPMERVALLDLTHDCADRVPLLVGCGTNSVRGTLANIQLFESSPANAFLIVVPYYNKPTQEGMYQYYKAIAAESPKPIVMYNVPGRTGVNMLPETAIRIARDIPGIIGIKEASGKPEQARAIVEAAPSDFVVLSGDDDLTLRMMKDGARGVISVASNIAPDKVSAMTSAALAGRWEDAEALNDALKPLYKACFVESNPIPAKAALSLLGLCSDTMRLPLVPASESTRTLMREVLDALK